MTPAVDLVNQVLTRARDPQGIATSRAVTLSLVSLSQVVVNGFVGDVVSSTALTIQPRTLLYQLSSFLPSAVKVIRVADVSGRDLDPLLSIDELSHLSSNWITDVSDSPQAWCAIGRDLIAIWPGVRTTIILNVFYTLLTPQLTTEIDVTVVPHETDNLIVDLATFLVRLKSRDLTEAKHAFDGMMTEFQTLTKEKR